MSIGTSRQVLTTKDSNAAALPQYFAAISATIGGFVMGTILGWSSPAGSLVEKDAKPFQVDSESFSWVSSLMAIGAIFGAGIAGVLADKFGRRFTILTMIVPSLIGWALMIWAKAVGMMYAGRVILGFAAGFLSVVAPLYTNEISETSRRGTLGTLFQLQCTMGILFSYVVGAFVDVFWLSVACGVIPIIFFALMMIVPESPKYYLSVGKKHEATKSLQWLRGSDYDITDELRTFQESIDEAEANRVSLAEAFSSKAAKKGMVIGLGVMFFQQFSGINAVIFNTATIFEKAGSTISKNVATIIVGAMSVVATFLSTLIIEKAGRKPLLFLSDSVMTICNIILGVYFYFFTNDHSKVENIGWLPLVTLSVFIILFSIGFGPIPWMFMSEIFPPEVKGPACSIACLFNWVCTFIVTKFFIKLTDVINNEGAFWLFGGLSALGSLFVLLLVPETKNKSLEEVVAILSGKSHGQKTWL